MKRVRARKTALVNVLDHLGIALALCDESTLSAEATMFRNIARGFALGRYSTCLEAYEREQGDDISVPTVDEVIERLGGAELMVKIRAEKSADERYPAAMLRLRRLIAEIPDGPLDAQLSLFLERALLSKWDGHEPERKRVNLLTLHSTKGLEFSRVYVVGVEDAQLPGGSPTNGAQAGGGRGSAPTAVRRHDAHEGPTRVDARGDARRQADARPPVSRRDGIGPRAADARS